LTSKSRKRIKKDEAAEVATGTSTKKAGFYSPAFINSSPEEDVLLDY
jgi:hypothetical protein